MALPKTDFKYTIYKTPSNGKIYYYNRIGSVLYLVQDSATSFRWNITSETRKIAGYSCQRASTTFAGRDYEAWFTREIPISDGPYKFSGLPGLIMNVSDTRRDYIFELVKLTKPKFPTVIEMPEQAAKSTTMHQLYEGSKGYVLNLASRQAGKGLSIGEARILDAREQVRRRNNMIELK